MTRAALKEFFLDVQAASPIPVMMYNFPGAAGGIDMDSDLIAEIAREGSNICGVKLTCGAVGKLTRITAQTATAGFADYPRKSSNAPQFVTLGGFADFLLPSVLGGRAHGAIMGLGNVYPNALARLFQLSEQLATSPQDLTLLNKALALQDLASATDQAFFRAGIAGTKWFLQKHNGYPTARMRRPLLDFDEEKGKLLEQDADVVKFLEIERSLAQ
jgi:dihydrodipicolinate synthase/N-acetylneuraminate lyase